METLEALQRRAATLRAEANALTTAYQRATWIRFTLVFFPVPFIVVLLRLQVESWAYFVFGAAYMGFSALLYVIDGRASDKCDVAEKAADRAQREVDAASSLAA